MTTEAFLTAETLDLDLGMQIPMGTAFAGAGKVRCGPAEEQGQTSLLVLGVRHELTEWRSNGGRN